MKFRLISRPAQCQAGGRQLPTVPAAHLPSCTCGSATSAEKCGGVVPIGFLWGFPWDFYGTLIGFLWDFMRFLKGRQRDFFGISIGL